MTTFVEELLDDLLTAAVSVLDDPPDRQFVAHGDWAHDCECVTAHLVDLALLPNSGPQGGAAGCAVIPQYTLRATVLRACWPVPPNEKAAEPDLITAASKILAADAFHLALGLQDLWHAGTLFPTAGLSCDQVTFIGMQHAGPEGGLAGWRMTLQVQP